MIDKKIPGSEIIEVTNQPNSEDKKDIETFKVGVPGQEELAANTETSEQVIVSEVGNKKISGKIPLDVQELISQNKQRMLEIDPSTIKDKIIPADGFTFLIKEKDASEIISGLDKGYVKKSIEVGDQVVAIVAEKQDSKIVFVFSAEQVEPKIKKEQFLGFLDSGKRLISAMRAREDQRLNPLWPEGEVAKIVPAIRNIDNLLSSKEISFENLESEIAKLFICINNIGRGPKTRGVKENLDSLTRIGFALNSLETESSETIKKLAKLNAEQSDGLKQRLYALSSSARDKKLYINRLRGAISRI